MAMPQVTADDVLALWAAEPLNQTCLAEVPDPDRIEVETRVDARAAGHYILKYQVDLREEYPEEPTIGEAEAEAAQINDLRQQALAGNYAEPEA